LVLELTLVSLVGFAVAIYFFIRRQKIDVSLVLPADSIQLKLLKLQPKISWCKYLEHVGDKGNKLAIQYKTIAHFESNSLTVLKQKFNSQEVTFARYFQVIEASNLILLDNLKKLIPLLETLDNISLSELSNQQELLESVDNLFLLNEQLLEKLNELVVNLSGLKNVEGPDQQTTQFLIENLGKLVERAKYY
jgi:hypothetical protein